MKGFKQRFGEEPEPTPVNQQANFCNAFNFFVSRQHGRNFSTCKDAVFYLCSTARWNVESLPKEVRLESGAPRIRVFTEGCLIGFVLLGDQCGGPIFIGNAQPATGGIKRECLVCKVFVVIYFLQAIS